MKNRKQARLYRNYKKLHTAYWANPLTGTMPGHELPDYLQVLGNAVTNSIHKLCA